MTSAWLHVALGEVAKFVRGITFKPADVQPVGTSGSIACMRTANVQAELDLTDVWAVPEAFCRRDEQRLRRGDLLVSTANSWNLVGKCAWVGDLPWPSTFGGFISTLRPSSPSLDQRYLYHWFSSPRIQATLRSYGRRTTSISNLNLEQCRATPILLPPIEEQRRIAALLDQADELRAKRDAALALGDSLNEAIFLDMFGDPAANPFGFAHAPLGDLATTTSGGTPDRSRRDYYGGSFPWVKSGELREPVVWSTEETITEKGLRGSSAKLMPAGTVMLAMYGATAGAVAVLGIEAATNQAICCISAGERVSPEYVVHCLRLLAPSLLRQRVGGAQPNLTQGLVRALPIPVPPMALQEAFTGKVSWVGVTTDGLARSAEVFGELFRSLQHRAFAGQL